MQSRGHVRSFKSYSPSQLNRMREDLQLSLPQELLARIQAYYRDLEKRDPAIDELLLLDRFVTKAAEEIHRSTLIDELYTNDAAIAATYADLMKKRHVLHPLLRRPMSMAEMADLATEYLTHAGKSPVSRGIRLFPEEHLSDKRAIPAVGSVGIDRSRFYVNTVTKTHSSDRLKTGDIVILFAKKELDSYRDYRIKTAKLLSSDAIAPKIKHLSTVEESGLLATLLQFCSGCRIELRRLTDSGAVAPMSTLHGRHVGCRLAVVSGEEYREVVQLFREEEISAFAFAVINDTSRFTVAQSAKEEFSFETAFLRSLLPFRKVAAKLPDEDVQRITKISHLPALPECSPYVRNRTCFPELAIRENAACAVASVSGDHSFFRQALYATLGTVLALTACGGKQDEERLTVCAALPKDVTDARAMGESVALLLGLYRAQAELGIPTFTRRIITDTEQKHPTLTVFSAAEANPQTKFQWTTEGCRAFYFAPKRNADGLPDFASLRQGLSELEKLCQRGAIRSFAIAMGESVTEVLARMSTERLTCHITNDAVAAEGPLSLAVIVEAYAASPSFVRIGEIHARPSIESDAEASDGVLPLAFRDSLIWSDKREVVLVAQRGDIGAQFLANELTARGARVRLFENSEEERLPLSRAILCAHNVILCRDVQLPNTRELGFALKTMTQAGGQTILLANATTEIALPTLAFPDGIEESFLSRMLEIKE